MTIMFGDVVYDKDPEKRCINAAPLTGEVFNIYNVKVYKFIKYLTQLTKAWNWIGKSNRDRYYLKSLMDHYGDSSKGKRHMNITKAKLKKMYFKNQDVFQLEKYVNMLKKAYNTLEHLNQPKL